MSPRTPRPAPEVSAAAAARITAAAAQRDKDLTTATDPIERHFWTQVQAELDASTIQQAEVATALGVSRETVRTRLKKYATPA